MVRQEMENEAKSAKGVLCLKSHPGTQSGNAARQ